MKRKVAWAVYWIAVSLLLAGCEDKSLYQFIKKQSSIPHPSPIPCSEDNCGKDTL